MQSWLEIRRIWLLRVTVCIFFAIGIMLSLKLWHSDRLFPLAPVFDGVPVLPSELDGMIPGLIVLVLLLGTLIKSRWLYVGLLILLVFVLLQDQMRWQPWVYLYFFMLAPFALFREHSDRLLGYFQILMIGVYLYSGVHKIGPGFLEGTFDKMLQVLFYMESPESRKSILWIGYAIPVIEILIALLLIFRKTRIYGVIGALITHIIILTYLIKADHNSVVYPWNIAMMIMVVVLFYKSTNQLNFAAFDTVRLKILAGLGALLFLIMPALNFAGLWDHYLSFKLYSGSNGQFCVGLNQGEYKKVDQQLQNYFWQVDEPEGKYWIYLSAWSYEELNVPFYAEMRVFKKIGHHFCAGDIPSDKLQFVKFVNDFSKDGAIILRCTDCE